jgi:hypothetical protein
VIPRDGCGLEGPCPGDCIYLWYVCPGFWAVSLAIRYPLVALCFRWGIIWIGTLELPTLPPLIRLCKYFVRIKWPSKTQSIDVVGVSRFGAFDISPLTLIVAGALPWLLVLLETRRQGCG